MAALERFRLNPAGARQLLRSGEVRSDLQRRADQVKVEADAQLAGLEGPHPDVLADSYVGSGRAGATVIGVPLPLEESRRILGSAIDAAG